MTDTGQRIKIIITNKISTVNGILDEEHMNVLNGEVSYESWRKTNARLLKQYGKCVRSVLRLIESGDLDKQEGAEFLHHCRSEKYLAKQRTDTVRKLMSKRLELKK